MVLTKTKTTWTYMKVTGRRKLHNTEHHNLYSFR